MNSVLRKVKSLWSGSPSEKLLRLRPANMPSRGKVLYSYIKEASLPQPDSYFDGHSNKWESREMVHILLDLGFEVDIVDWSEDGVDLKESYDAVFDIYIKHLSWLPKLSGALRLLHLTGSEWHFQNRAELKRIRELERRKGRHYVPRRQVAYPDLLDRALELATNCSLIGGSATLSTYPESYRSKFTCVPVSGSASFQKPASTLIPPAREFLWLGGGGLVHKGLDLVLDAFSGNPNLTLNVIGDVEAEPDFVEIYKRELYALPNIRVHGYLTPLSPLFRTVVENCFCFISPSCSEGQSGAAATCMQIGLYPLVSRETGIDLPIGAGRYLQECTPEGIIDAATELNEMSEERLREEIQIVQSYGIEKFSRNNFTKVMRSYFTAATADIGS